MIKLRFKKIYAQLAFATIFGALYSIFIIIPNMDDNKYELVVQNFSTFSEKIRYLWTVLWNKDFIGSGQVRTYGVSRVLQVAIIYLFKNSHSLFMFFIPFTHIMSGFLLEKLLKRLRFSEFVSLLSAILWAASPFIKVQTFHHFSYLMLPYYFIMLFSFVTLYYWQEGKITKSKAFITKYIISAILLFCCVFTGEASLPTISIITCLFIIKAISNKDTFATKIFFSYLALEIFLVLSYIFYFKFILGAAPNQRFVFTNAINIQYINYFFKGIIDSIRLFMYTERKGAEFFSLLDPQVYYSLNIIVAIICISSLCLLCWIAIKEYKKQSTIHIAKTGYTGKKSFTILAILLILISSFSLYLLISIFMRPATESRYFSIPLSIFTISLFLFLSMFLSNKKTLIAFLIILVISFYSHTLFFSVYLPDIKNLNTEAIEELEKARDHKKNIVVLNCNSLSDSVLKDPSYITADSPFISGWMFYFYIHSRYDFKSIIYCASTDSIIDNGDDTLTIIDAFTLKKSASLGLNEVNVDSYKVNKDSCLFLGIGDESRLTENGSRSKRFYFHSYEDYINNYLD